jgi:hypothetical protein
MLADEQRQLKRDVFQVVKGTICKSGDISDRQ